MASSSSSSPEISSAGADIQDRFSYKHASHDEVLEDLSSRFILNLPDEELASLERICFQVEQAHWFYEDFIREENPKFPSLPLKKFSAMLFHACPLLHQWSHDHEQAFNTFMQYKTRVPVCGAIMLNDTWEKCILVKGWKSSSGWGFPKGKINEDEPEPNCAVREVLEETGYNLADQIDPQDVIEMSIKEQKISLYIVAGIPEDYPFKTKTRKEISKIEWFKLTDLPTWKRNKAAPGKFYLISPFIGALKTFINERKPRGPPRKGPKYKNGESSQIRPEADQPPTLPQFSTYHDNTQESSSQSSSADNGDPHTPSPQYTESIASYANGPSVAQDDLTRAIATQTLDPHFARLLTSLSVSANAARKDDVKPPIAIYTQDQVPAPATPVPVTASSTSSHRSLERVDQPDWSTSVPTRLSDRPVDQSYTPLSASSRLPSNGIPSLLSRSTTTTRPSQLSPVFVNPRPIDNGSRRRQSGQFPTAPSSSSVASLAVSPPRGMTSRRSSSTADISPYLTRPSEMPTSAKRLKQLALLESVADESARLTPLLSNREPSCGGQMNGSPMPPASRSLAPELTGSVPPAYRNDPNDLRVIYSSGPGAVHGRSALSSFHAPPLHDDVFQIRPRTSNSFHHLPIQPQVPSNTSMNQDQLLTLMNDTRVQNVPVYPSPSGTYRDPFFLLSAARLGHPLGLQHSLPRNYGHPTQPMYSQLGSGATVPPSFDMPQHSTKRLTDNAHLLSILNGNPTGAAGPGAMLAAQMNNGIGQR